MARRQSTTKRVSAPVEKADREFLDRLAAQQERSLSWVVARVIHLFVVEARKKPGGAPAGFSSNGRES
jgi:hypothetical protein